MSSKLISSILAVCALGFAGCATARSPISPEASPDKTTFGEGALLTATTAGGAAGGYALTHSALGAAAGAGVGLIGGAVVNNIVSDSSAQHDAELAEAARREERVKLEAQYWDAERLEGPIDGSKRTPGGRNAESNVDYPGGYFDGVNVAPHSGGGDTALQEPQRP